MRYLFITRGLPGSGKSTWLKEHFNQSYIISPDDIRMQYAQVQLKSDGTQTIKQTNDKKVWEQVMKLLEFRMQNGDTTIIDATHTTIDSIKRYRSLCEQYRYSLNVFDFSSVPVEICKKRNKERDEYKIVPEEVIDNMNERLQESLVQKFPTYINIIDPKTFNISFEPRNFNCYQKVIVFGDIHGCIEPLQAYFQKDPEMEDTAYIFTGDYLDRGLQNKETLEWFLEHQERKNFYFLEGNHEKWLRLYSKKGTLEGIHSKEFIESTYPQIKDIDLSSIRNFIRRLRTFMYIEYAGKEYVITHGGIPTIPTITLNENDYIKGVGKYEESEICDESFGRKVKKRKKPTISIHGHRNINKVPIINTAYSLNLEGQVEFGGDLRIVTINRELILTFEIRNNTFKDPNSNDIIITKMEHNNFIKKKQLKDGISSYNFTKDAFIDGHWDNITTKARGLFVRDDTKEIVARSYNKFFNYEELPETSKEMLEKNLQFPIHVYYKENGYLGILSYDTKKDDWFIASKSTNEGDYAQVFKELLTPYLSEELKKYLIENKVSMVFEVIHPTFDPHIIPYKTPRLFLLDIIENQFKFSKMPYKYLVEEGKHFGFLVKKEFPEVIRDFDSLMNFIELVQHLSTTEGFVLEDSSGYMFKLKTYWYKYWKMLRNKKLDTEGLSKVFPQYDEYTEIVKTLNKEDFMREDKPSEINILKVQETVMKERFK